MNLWIKPESVENSNDQSAAALEESFPTVSANFFSQQALLNLAGSEKNLTLEAKHSPIDKVEQLDSPFLVLDTIKTSKMSHRDNPLH